MEKPVHNASACCLNCKAEMPEGAKFCSQCGQKNTDGRTTVKQLFLEFLDAFFNLDNRVWKTFRDIWIPGKLTKAYFEGRHRTYMHPLRLFLVVSLIHFTTISLKTSEAVTSALEQFSTQVTQYLAREDYHNRLDSLATGIKSVFPEPQASLALDSLLSISGKNMELLEDTSLTVSWSIQNSRGEQVKIPLRDLFAEPYDTLVKKYDIQGFVSKVALKQQIRAARNPDTLYASFIANLLWMVLMMMAVLALVLKLLYIRGHWLFVEHVVFSFHYHAFAFLLITPFYAFLPEAHFEWVWVPFCLSMVYLYFAMRFFYKEGWIRTFFKMTFLLFSYLFIFLFCVAFTITISFFLF